MSGPRFDTRLLHAGSSPDPATGARAVPIHFTSGYAFRDAGHAASLLNMERAGHVDPLWSNPTSAVLEERIAALEGGVAGIAAASGQAALHLALATLAGAGSHVVAARTLDGAARSLLACGLRRFGVETSFVDPRDPDAWAAAIRPGTRLLFGPALGPWGLELLDIPRVAAVAHAHDLPLMVDATLATPALLKPLEHGADLVLHSAAAFLCGHGTALGGLLVDGGGFDWHGAHRRSGRFGALCEPSEGMHGVVYAEESTVGAFALRARHEGLRDFGAAIGPHNAFAILQGIETLAVRMERHVASAARLAGFLAQHPAVAAVRYPGLPGHPDHALARILLPRGGGGVLSFDLTGDLAAARRCVESLRVFGHGAEVGDARSLAVHPASTTHDRLAPEQRAAAGLGEATIRLSVGLEDPDDLLEDLERALRSAVKKPKKEA